MKKAFLVSVVVLAVLASAGAQAAEFRSFWVDAWHAGCKSEAQTQAMVNYIKSCNCNAIVAQMGKVADAYHPSSYFPWAVDADSTYDALADVISKAHAQGMEVHAWYCVYRVWTQLGSPPQSFHVVNQHPDWRSQSASGAYYSGTSTYLDPGVPAVEDWLVDAFMEVVQNYDDLDGITFDRIRYPGTDWGYNPITVARFNQEYGYTGDPNPGNTDWTDWRKVQINAFVKKFYCNAMAVNPNLKVGAAVWKTALTGSRDYLQDWDAWMAGHYIDYVSPMNYTSSSGDWHSNNVDGLSHAYGRHVYPAQDTCGNTAESTVAQVTDAQTTGMPGCILYSYNCAGTTLRDLLIAGPWDGADTVPAMTWKSSPSYGILKGTVTNSSGTPLYNATVAISGTGKSTKTDGTGFAGILDVGPGTYTVTCSANGHTGATTTGVVIAAGSVTTANFSLTPETVPPVISGVGAGSIQATNVMISWTTDEPSTTQVEYGLTTSYGSLTAENTRLVTGHSAQLLNLTANTTYHYRVISKDAVNNTATSGDFTFTTAGYDTPADIILDNDAATGVTFNGSWITSSGATDKYGANYRYCSGATQGKTCTWTPNVITAGRYNVYAWWSAGVNRTTHAPYFVQWSGGSQSVSVNQQIDGGRWNLLVPDKQFSDLDTGFVRLSNSGVESTLNVIADAIKLEFSGDLIPPSTPTGLTAAAASTTQINLSWTASTDNVGVTGYKVYRNGVQIGTSATTTYSSGSLTPSTAYTYTVSAYDASGNNSPQSSSVVRYTLPVAPTTGNVTCNKSTETWYTGTSFVFTATDGFGPGTRQYYRMLWDTEPTHVWAGGEEHWVSGTLEETCEDSGSYYLHVQSCNGDGVANGTLNLGPYRYDNTAPQIGSVNDQGAYTDAGGQLSADWTGSDAESGIAEYQYAIGTTPGNIGSVRDWTTVGTSTTLATTDLTLESGTTYYIGVKARNNAGLWSSVSVSNGVTAGEAVATIAQAKARPDAGAVMLQDKVVSADFDTYFYIAEPKPTAGDCQYGGIRVNGTAPDEGVNVDISGILQILNGERVLTAPEIITDGTANIPDPLLLTNRTVGGEALNINTPGITGADGTNNLGLLITTFGEVKYSETGLFYMDDGCNLDDGSGHAGIKVLGSVPGGGDPVGRYVKVTGISATEQSGSAITRLVIAKPDGVLVLFP